MGVGGAIPGYILAATGYVANAKQTPSAIFGIILVAIVIPALINIAAGFIFGFGYKLNKKTMTQVYQDLKERRGEKSGEESIIST